MADEGIAHRQLAEDGLAAVLVVPRLMVLHHVEDLLQARIARRGKALLVPTDEIGRLVAMPEAGFDDGQVARIDRRLFEVADAYPIMEDHLPLVCKVPAGNNVQQSGLACTILCNEPNLLPLPNAEVYSGK